MTQDNNSVCKKVKANKRKPHLDLIIRFLVWSLFPDANFSIFTRYMILLILFYADLDYI